MGSVWRGAGWRGVVTRSGRNESLRLVRMGLGMGFVRKRKEPRIKPPPLT